MTIKDMFMLHALVEVKSQRMPKQQAFEEAKRQRDEGINSLTVEYLDDCYKAAQILYKRFQWFRRGVRETVLRIQRMS